MESTMTELLQSVFVSICCAFVTQRHASRNPYKDAN